MEVPFWNDNLGKRRREINLGGTSSAATSHSSLLQDVRQRRMQRDEQKRRHTSATRIQSWWRGRRQAALVRQELRTMFLQNVTNVTGLRCLVLIGKDEELLGVWSHKFVLEGGGVYVLGIGSCSLLNWAYSQSSLVKLCMTPVSGTSFVEYRYYCCKALQRFQGTPFITYIRICTQFYASRQVRPRVIPPNGSHHAAIATSIWAALELIYPASNLSSSTWVLRAAR